MLRRLRRTLVGDADTLADVKVSALVTFGAFLVSFALTAVIQLEGMFPVSPLSVLVGVTLGVWFGYHERGLVFAWAGAYAAMTGHVFRNALLDSVFNTVSGRFEYLAGALLYVAVLAVLSGALAYAIGWLLHAGIRFESANTDA